MNVTRQISACLLAMLLATAVHAESGLPRVRVGESGTLTLAAAEALEAKPASADADIVVSVSRHASTYTITFVPTRPGTFDLRDFLQSTNGGAVSLNQQLAVTAFSTLTAADDLEIAPIEPTPPPKFGGYKVLAVTAAIVWLLLLVPLTFWKRPRRAKPSAPVAAVVLPPSPDEELQALTREFRECQPTSAQKLRLETLLLDHWRRRLRLDDLTFAEAMRAMRAAPESAPTIAGLEHYLHAPGEVRSNALATLLDDHVAAAAGGRA